jgi:hypothetical protein
LLPVSSKGGLQEGESRGECTESRAVSAKSGLQQVK